jgi:SsrA-binding protein
MQFVHNKKAHLTYSLGETFESGIELTGQEVKSIKGKQGSLDGARVILRGGEAYLIGCFIPPYQANNAGKSYDPHRVRKLLLSRKELAGLYKDGEEKNLTIIPLSLYSKGLFIKCENQK